jgi:hypothetical protein
VSEPDRRPGNSRVLLGIAGALLVTILLRAVWMDSDPPARISWSNGIFTDPPVLVHDARNHALFGRWILDYNRDVWVFPLMNA